MKLENEVVRDRKGCPAHVPRKRDAEQPVEKRRISLWLARFPTEKMGKRDTHPTFFNRLFAPQLAVRRGACNFDRAEMGGGCSPAKSSYKEDYRHFNAASFAESRSPGTIVTLSLWDETGRNGCNASSAAFLRSPTGAHFGRKVAGTFHVPPASHRLRHMECAYYFRLSTILVENGVP